MTKTIIGILVGVIIFLIGLVILLWESFGSELYWIGLAILVVGIVIISIFVTGKIKKWF